ncbi:MAG: serine phosphatase RsbU (regulator of sigma subunit) [Parvicellaceae bacterium]|jgi:serine phosphatase RsbU (regulator of sigma subunit)
MELEKGDSIHIFSDGYVDQFGGEKGKKFKPTNLHKLLLSIQNQSINQSINQWRNKERSWMGLLSPEEVI